MRNACLLILLLICFNARAQLCNGSLGDAVVSNTYGSGTNPGPALTATLPNLTYTTASCPNDGFYTIANSLQGCFGGDWHNFTQDHTPNDVNGYMMVINASLNSGTFYQETVNNLCGGTTYEFSAWIVNIEKPTACSGNPIKPNITFYIETTSGTILNTYNTGNIAGTSSPQWAQYGLFFTTPAGVSDVVLRMASTAAGGCGNDFALDDIAFKPCGPQSSISVIGGSGSAQITQCEGTQSQMVATVGAGFTNPAYQWQMSTDNINWTDIPGATSLTYTNPILPEAMYYFRIAVAEASNIGISNCRVQSPAQVINIVAPPVVVATSNSPVCVGGTLQLSATGGSGEWSGPNGFTSSFSTAAITPVTLAAAGTYTVTIRNNFSCATTKTINVVVNQFPTTVSANASTCKDVPVQLNATGGTSYTWVPATGLSATNIANPIALPATTTIYKVEIVDGSCTVTLPVTVTVLSPSVNAGGDKTIIEGQSAQLAGTITDAASYTWSPLTFLTGSISLTPTATPPTGQYTYTLTAYAQGAACPPVSDDVTIKVLKKIVVPNAFSPNWDGINDRWVIEGLDSYVGATLKVFNRYGQVVYNAVNYQSQWNGYFKNKQLPVGTYYYILDLKNGQPVVSGAVSILR